MTVGKCLVIAVATAACAACIAPSAIAAKFNKKVDIGSQAPAWKNLEGVDGKNHSLDDYRGAKLVVVAFTCNHCPVAQLYEERFIQFVKKHKPSDLAFVAINGSLAPTDTLEKMKERANDKRLSYDYLFDSTQKTSRDFGATVTPQLFVLDSNRQIAYMGKFDDSIEPDQVHREFVQQAVEALLSGKQPETAETRATGCGIEYIKAE